MHRLLWVGVLLPLFLVGCGDSDADTNAEPPGSSASARDEASDDSASDGPDGATDEDCSFTADLLPDAGRIEVSKAQVEAALRDSGGLGEATIDSVTFVQGNSSTACDIVFSTDMGTGTMRVYAYQSSGLAGLEQAGKTNGWTCEATDGQGTCDDGTRYMVAAVQSGNPTILPGKAALAAVLAIAAAS